MKNLSSTSVLALALSLLLVSCGGGSDKSSDDGGVPSVTDQEQDQEGPASAPTATGPTGPVGGASYDLAIVCNEAKEVVSITGKGLKPDPPQTHTCKASGADTFSLRIKQGVSFPSPNDLTISSTDEHGNSAGNTTTVDVPIDTLAPSVAITNGGDIIEGSSASFEVTVMDDHIEGLSYIVSVNQGSANPTTCTVSPCTVTVSGALEGSLTLTVAAGGVVDDAGNSNAAQASNSLNVGATTLSVTSAPIGTSLNAASYEVMGTCVASQGDVTVTVATASPVTVDCAGDPGTYTASLDISGVTASPLSVMAEQGVKTANLSPSPVNDQNGPTLAPTATGPSAPVGGTSYNLAIDCNEAAEVVSITGNGLEPDPQIHACAGSGADTFSLSLKQGSKFSISK